MAVENDKCDLISRERLRKMIKATKRCTGDYVISVYWTGYVVALSTLEGLLADLPAVDAVPVVHGRCVVCERGNERCAACRYFFDYDDDGGHDKCSSHCCDVKCSNYKPVNFCPNCGARMDKEADDALD